MAIAPQTSVIPPVPLRSPPVPPSPETSPRSSQNDAEEYPDWTRIGLEEIVKIYNAYDSNHGNASWRFNLRHFQFQCHRIDYTSDADRMRFSDRGYWFFPKYYVALYVGQGQFSTSDARNDIALWSSTNHFSLLYIGALPDDIAAQSLAVDAEWLTQYIHEQRELPRQDALGE